ncbi:cation:proton antiporter [Oceanirhabdus seepicola]|uniref:Cation:proton antiporter n=1 Tax=Oceanirhabdus seepicola TaxID=2828781 RepID=A0A9J6P1Q1_9CLOT|nr:cation:proton antiporter [Oceanirhabdus seepicola]MCM1989432.1 cation:proton antiporter [Oceanirhabdus seepicola]
MIKGILLLIVFIAIAIMVGKLATKVKMPAILGWLLTGMLIGPYALGWLSDSMLNSTWFHVISSICEITAGLFIGTELIWKDLKKSGKQILTICFTEAFGAFLIVTVAFGCIFAVTDIPIYLAFIFGAIALATAPAPSLSIINEYKAKGPVTSTLIPLAILDDVIALIVFFMVIGIISNILAGGGLPLYYAPLIILLSIIVGIVMGVLASFVLKKEVDKKSTIFLALACIIATTGVGMYINEYILPEPMMNLMLVGVTFSATFANIIPRKRLDQIKENINIVIILTMIILIINLGAPLDFHLILGAGLFTAIYIVARAIGKLGGAYIGAVISKAPVTVKKYLGFTLLPHSGVSLIFTGIAVSTLMQPAPEYAEIIQGTIAAAAVINEVIAVILAKQGFKLAGELDGKKELELNTENVIQAS